MFIFPQPINFVPSHNLLLILFTSIKLLTSEFQSLGRYYLEKTYSCLILVENPDSFKSLLIPGYVVLSRTCSSISRSTSFVSMNFLGRNIVSCLEMTYPSLCTVCIRHVTRCILRTVHRTAGTAFGRNIYRKSTQQKSLQIIFAVLDSPLEGVITIAFLFTYSWLSQILF